MKTKSCSPQARRSQGRQLFPLVLLILAFSGCGEFTGLPPDYINFYRKVYPVNDWDELKEKAEDSQGPGLIGLTKSFSTPASGISIRVRRKLVITNFKGETAIIRQAGFTDPIFKVAGGRLTLGYPGRGQVTLDGNGQNGSVLAVSPGGELVMESGIITRGRNTGNGGGVRLEGGAVFTMNGGTITGNTAATGGGVYAAPAAVFTMNGGTITGNTAETGGGVYRGGTFTRNGGTVSGNTGGNVAPGYYSLVAKPVSGQESYGTVTGSAANIAEGSLVTVTADAGPDCFFVKWTAADSAMGASIAISYSHEVTITADTVIYAVFNGHGSSASFPSEVYTAYDLTGLQLAANNSYYKLGTDIIIGSSIPVTAAGVTLDGNGKIITRNFDGHFFRVNDPGVNIPGASLTLTNIILDGGSGPPPNGDPLVYVYDGGTLTLNSGTILRNNNVAGSINGAGGAKVAGGRLIMNDGASITGNRADIGSGGGGVQMVGGEFIMYGGIISGNTGGGGGGVYVSSGTFTVNCPAANINGNTPNNVAKASGTINGTGNGVNTGGW